MKPYKIITRLLNLRERNPLISMGGTSMGQEENAKRLRKYSPCKGDALVMLAPSPLARAGAL